MKSKKVYVVTRTRTQDEWEYGYYVDLEQAKKRCDFHRRYDDKYHHTEVREYEATRDYMPNYFGIITDDTKEAFYVDYDGYTVVY